MLLKKNLQFSILSPNPLFFEKGRCLGVEIGINRIYIVYLPVSSDEPDKINLCYEGLGQLVSEAKMENKLITIIGDFNSHLNGYLQNGSTD